MASILYVASLCGRKSTLQSYTQFSALSLNRTGLVPGPTQPQETRRHTQAHHGPAALGPQAPSPQHKALHALPPQVCPENSGQGGPQAPVLLAPLIFCLPRLVSAGEVQRLRCFPAWSWRRTFASSLFSPKSCLPEAGIAYHHSQRLCPASFWYLGPGQQAVGLAAVSGRPKWGSYILHSLHLWLLPPRSVFTEPLTVV